MDKNSLVGLLLMAVLLFGYSWYSSEQQKKFEEQKALVQAVEIEEVDQEDRPENVLEKDSLTLVNSIGQTLYGATKGVEQLYRVENDVMTITFSNHGAKVESVVLKDYKRYGGEPLDMFADGSSKFDMSMFIREGFGEAHINTSNFYFTTTAPKSSVVSGDQNEISMRLYVDSVSYVEYLYTIEKDNYMIDFDVNFVGMQDKFSNQKEILVSWANEGLQNEKGFDNENNYSSVDYMLTESNKFESLGMSKDAKSEIVEEGINWVAFKQQFFSSVFIADANFGNATLDFTTFKSGSGKIKGYGAEIAVPFNKNQSNYGFKFYFGPNKYSILKKYDLGVEKLVAMGGTIVGSVNRWLVVPVFDFLGKYISNYGLIILILTIMIKILIAPLTYKSYLSTAKMRLLKPEMDEISAQYPNQDDAMKKQQATMDLYRRAGVNPMGGCIPMLIQFPILIAMFRFFPGSIELRGEHFLWADDLSSYDSIINLPFSIPFYGDHVSLFPLLMAVSVYISARINYAQSAQSAPQMAGMKFMMLYMMPLMMLFWFNNYSSGLSYYYLISNIITIGQTYAFRYAIDDQKLHARMKANAVKAPKKKSAWQQKYEELLKEQQQAKK